MFCVVWIRGTKSQYFPGSNFPRAKPFRTKRQAQKGRNCCSRDSVIIFLELIESTYSLLKTCSACIFKKNWYSFENVQKILKQTGTILKIMKPSGLKVWDHREISQQFYHMKSYGNIRVALRLWQMFWKYLEMSRSRLERMRSSWNIETSGRFVSHPEISVLKPSREFWDHLEISQITPKFLCYGPI